MACPQKTHWPLRYLTIGQIDTLLHLNPYKTQDKQSRCIPELALEVVEDRGTPEFAGASGACSEGLPLLVKELMAHLSEKKMVSD